MGILLVLVAVDLLRINALLPQQVIKQDPGTGAALPVNIADACPGQICEITDVHGVAFSQDQPLFTVNQVDKFYLSAGKQPFYIGNIVIACFLVKQVDTRAVSLAAP
ncbi:MAG: hypothetical protein BWY65_01384 [Firmicutes bacterium ADurb.Bin373]|nr:MAG: hypothetical protein BWY65_01384 [Firmicutes bacterium ADurb.Bin373]